MTSKTCRPPLTSTEKTLLTELVNALTKSETQFCCGGTIEVPPKQKLSLLYKLGLGEHARSIDMPATDPATIEKLLGVCAPAPHGRGNETVYDESYRLARELQQGDFALTLDLMNQSELLDGIAALTSPRDPSGKLVAYLYKLNSYSVGGFFKPHRDTPKSDRHIGSIVVALPVPFEGGVLRVSHEGRDVLFDWSSTVSSAIASGNVCLPWAFLFSDVEHEVLPVTSGTRITLAYDVYVSSEKPVSTGPVVDGITLPFYPDLQALLNNPEFLPNGGKLGLALSHAYPVDKKKKSSRFFASRLKGSDAALFRVLLALKIPTELRAVYQLDESLDPHDIVPFPPDGYGPDVEEYSLLFTSKYYSFVNYTDQWDGMISELLQDQVQAQLEPEIIWGRKPHQTAFTEAGNFIGYGNEASLAYVYAAAALVLDIPALGKGARAI